MPEPPAARRTAPRPVRDLLAGSLNALAALALLLTLGLLAHAPLGAAAGGIGVTAGFVCVVVGGLVYALLGAVASPAGGPSSATALILGGLVLELARDSRLDLGSAAGLASLLAVASLSVVLMGVLQLVMAWFGLGRLARFVPQPVLAGFMNGVALLIVVSQLPPLLGLPPLMRLTDPAALSQVQPLSLVLGLVAAGVVWAVGRRWPQAPATLIGLLAGCGVYALLALAAPGLPLGPQVGVAAQGPLLPDMLGPMADPQTLALLQRHAASVALTALVLAVVGTLESLLAALAVDQAANQRHDSRRELIALGCANIVGGGFGGLPLVLSRMRATALLQAGAAGRPAALYAGAAAAVLYAAGGPLTAWLPRSVLAGIMLTIAVALVDGWTRQLLRRGERSRERDASLALVAAVGAVTVVFGFVAAVAAGVLLSLVVFVRTMNRSLLRARCSGAERPSRRVYAEPQEAALRDARHRVTLLELEGALFFGSGERLLHEVDTLAADCRVLLIDLRRVSTLDESGAVLLQQLSRQLGDQGVALLLAGVQPGNAHGRRLRAFGCFSGSERPDWWPDADRAMEAAERLLLADHGITEPQHAVALADSSLLRGLDERQRQRLDAAMPRLAVAAGQHLLHAGDPGDCLFVLTAGSISIIGPEQPVAHRYVSFSPGVMLGEIAMLDGQPRTADAVADTDTEVRVLTRDTLAALGAEDPALGERLLRNIALHLAERLRAAANAWRASAT